MVIASSVPLDPIRELRLRSWARRNFVPVEERGDSWHPIVLDEMARRDRERPSANRSTVVTYESIDVAGLIDSLVPAVGDEADSADSPVQFVPLHPGVRSVVHPPHAGPPAPNLLNQRETTGHRVSAGRESWDRE